VLLRLQGAVPEADLRQAVRVQGRRPADVELPAAVAAAARELRARHLRDRQRVQPRLRQAPEVPRAMRRLAVIIAAVAVAAPAPASASAATVHVMVAGKDR